MIEIRIDELSSQMRTNPQLKPVGIAYVLSMEHSKCTRAILHTKKSSVNVHSDKKNLEPCLHISKAVSRAPMRSIEMYDVLFAC